MYKKWLTGICSFIILEKLMTLIIYCRFNVNIGTLVDRAYIFNLHS